MSSRTSSISLSLFSVKKLLLTFTISSLVLMIPPLPTFYPFRPGWSQGRLMILQVVEASS